MYKSLFSLIIALFIGINIAYAQELDWMPDPALREAVREKLGIPADNPLTLAYVQLHLTNLDARDKGDETKGQFYVNRAGETIDGLFIREFTNGWAVYNRSGKSQTVNLPMETTGIIRS